MALSQPVPVGGQETRKRIERPQIAEKQYIMDYLGVDEGEQNAYEDRHKAKDDPTAKKVPVYNFKFAIVLPKADEMQTRLEALPAGPERDALFEEFKAKFLDKGHGMYMWKTVNQVALRLPKGEGRVSNLIAFLQQFINNKKPFTEADLPTVGERLNALENRKTGPNGELVPIVPDEQFVRPQFYGFVIVGSNGKNYLDRISGRVDEDDTLPSYRPIARAIDAREADDDPSVVCAECGEPIHGQVSKYGENKGQWMPNTEVAEDSVERYGAVLCGAHRGEARRKQQAAQAKTEAQGMPF